MLSARLAVGFRVVCVDLPGRGQSERLADATLYGDDTYCADLGQVIERLALGRVRWVGTSLGGRLGMKMASAEPQRVKALVLNDIGAELDGAELARLRAEAAQEASFADLDEAEAWMRRRYAAFGPLGGERWRAFTQTSVEQALGGRLRPCFDTRAVPAASIPSRVDLWQVWDGIRCPVLVLRGAESKLLSRETCEAMSARGPRSRWIEVRGAGHAPDLSDARLIEAISKFLESTL